ncbi:MAG: chromate efflux transporter [Gemmatimonadetes bacterium]|nr:chromate efflux transporter [Gemmatimonadota bacterium]
MSPPDGTGKGGAEPLAPVPFGAAARFWFWLGCVSFGGPAGQIAIMHEELVERRRWVSEGRFLHALNYCMLLPGPEAQQLATYIGWLLHRTPGGLVAGACFVLPSLVLLILLSWTYAALGHLPAVAGVFAGLQPAVLALVLHAVHRIGRRTLTHPLFWGIALLGFGANTLLGVPFPLVIAAAALAGLAGQRLLPAAFARATPAHGAPAAVVDDAAPPPPHARWSLPRFVRVVALGLACWIIPIGALALAHGWHGALTQMAWFFTTAALLTFGGAYAVLPYVYQGAVGHYGWLTGPQMIDGLALGESTSGPLIMVVTFVGFVGGWQVTPLGAAHPLASGIAGALVATWFTFLPSFLFILAGGPLVESTHGEPRFTAPLTGVTAAVVGVMLGLAVFFGRHVFWPDLRGGGFDLPNLLLALAALVALVRFKVGVLPVLGAAALLGIARALIS